MMIYYEAHLYALLQLCYTILGPLFHGWIVLSNISGVLTWGTLCIRCLISSKTQSHPWLLNVKFYQIFTMGMDLRHQTRQFYELWSSTRVPTQLSPHWAHIPRSPIFHPDPTTCTCHLSPKFLHKLWWVLSYNLKFKTPSQTLKEPSHKTRKTKKHTHTHRHWTTKVFE